MRPLISCKDEKVLREALKKCDLNKPTGFQKDTYLHLFVKTRNKMGVKVCLELGADINAEDGDGYDAVHIAAMYSQPKTLRMLLNHPQQRKPSPFHNHIPIRSARCVFLLMDRGVWVELIAKDIIPNIRKFEIERNECRRNAILFIALRPLGLCKNLARLIGKHIWSLRMHVPFNI